MRYWFRGIEKFMPFVNKIFFVTWGHIPEWLNTDNEKLVIVNHRDYIPEKYLPTYNSNVIEMNFHRIKDLSECFVNFNDDMFITDYVTEDYFFKKGSILIELKQYEEAIESLNEVLKLNPNHIKALILKGNCYDFLDLNKESLKIYNNIISKDKNNETFL